MSSRIRIAILALFAATTPCIGELTLIEQRKPRCVIVTPADPSESVTASAEALAHYLRKMAAMDYRVHVIAQNGLQAEHEPLVRIHVGRTDAAAAMIGDQTIDNLHEEGFVIRTQGSVIAITGRTDLGTRHGVYDFMERALDIRWYWPGELGEVVPYADTVKVKPINRDDQPDFSMRYWHGGFETAWFLTKDDYRHYLGAAKANQGNWLSMGHNYTGLVMGGYMALTGKTFNSWREARQELYETHPQWFALHDGERVDPAKAHAQLCTSNPELVDCVVKGVLRYFEINPHIQSISLSPEDTNNFCECDRCRSLDAEHGNLTDRIMLFNSQIIDRVNEKLPGKLYGWYAYLSVRRPPQSVEVPDQLVVCLAPEPWNVAHVVPWETPGVAGNARIIADLEGWHEKADRIVMREYYGLATIYGPFPIEEAQAANFRLYRDNYPQVLGFSSEWFNNWPMQGLGFYMICRAAWDADTDARATLEEYCHRFFGPAGPTMLQYHDRLHAAAAKAVRQALSEAQTERQRQRIGLILDTYHARTLWQRMKDHQDIPDRWRPLAQQLIDDVNMQLREPTYTKYASEYGSGVIAASPNCH